MAVHAIDTIDLSWGVARWNCDCGRSFYSQAGFNRHLKVAPGMDTRPWAFIRRGA